MNNWSGRFFLSHHGRWSTKVVLKLKSLSSTRQSFWDFEVARVVYQKKETLEMHPPPNNCNDDTSRTSTEAQTVLYCTDVIFQQQSTFSFRTEFQQSSSRTSSFHCLQPEHRSESARTIRIHPVTEYKRTNNIIKHS